MKRQWRRSRANHASALNAAAALGAMVLLACGGSGKPADEPAAGDDGEPAESSTTRPQGGPGAASSPSGESEAEAQGMPRKCAASSQGMCLPPSGFVKKLCGGDFPTVTLMLFSGASPWTHGYLTRDTRAWNASGGGASDEELKFDEEVVVLRHRTPSSAGGIVVSGASGGYDVLRWNGACVTLTADELTMREPPHPKNARIIWTRLEPAMKEALRGDPEVDKWYKAWRKECKGVTVGEVSKKCVKADTALAKAIAEFVREGGKLAQPEFVP